MQLGMIGLGRMGANMVRRLMRGGHQCVVWDQNQANVEQLAKDGAEGRPTLQDFLQRLKPPRAVWLMVPAAAVDGTLADLSARMEGGDFFASVTFPVGDSYCTWVNGGWGGDIVGLSSLDGWDASDNETRTYFNFENGRWYALRLQVTADRIMAWIDDKAIVNLVFAGRSISLRHGEIKLSAPFGLASYATAGGVRKIEYRLLKP